MTNKLTLKEALKNAIEKEIYSQRLYTSLSQVVAEPPVREALLDLVRQEQGHQYLLEQYLSGELKGGALDQTQVIDYRIAEHLDYHETSSEMKLKDVFLLAASREKLSHDFYLALAALHPAGRIKKLFSEIAAQELVHKQKVEQLFTEVAFPQTDGG